MRRESPPTNSDLFSLGQIIEQVRTLVAELCKAFNTPIPTEELAMLDQPLSALLSSCPNTSTFPTENSTDSGFSNVPDDNDMQQRASDTEEDSDMEDEDLPIEMEEEAAPDKSKDDGLSREHTATLERLKQSQRDSYLKGSVSGSVQGERTSSAMPDDRMLTDCVLCHEQRPIV